MLLVTHGQPTMERFASPYLGRLIQPRHYSSIEKTAASGIPWAADNDCFQGLDHVAFSAMLDRIKGLHGCLWVTCPDVVGDHTATVAQFYKWSHAIARRGLPIAFVLQDGCTSSEVPWRDIAAVFVGGSTEFKMSDTAAELVTEAKRRGKWAHMGRVNSLQRIRHAAAIGCDSVDGTKYSRFVDTWLAEGLCDVAGPAQGMFA